MGQAVSRVSDSIKRQTFAPPQPPTYDERGVVARDAASGAVLRVTERFLPNELRRAPPVDPDSEYSSNGGSNDGGDPPVYVALVWCAGVAADDARRLPTVLYSHGNASDIGSMLSAARSMARTVASGGIGCNVALYDYTGYGLSQRDAAVAARDAAEAAANNSDDDDEESDNEIIAQFEGRPMRQKRGAAKAAAADDDDAQQRQNNNNNDELYYRGEAALLVDAARCEREAYAVYRHLVDVERLLPARIVLWGTSVGSGPACALAARLSDAHFQRHHRRRRFSGNDDNDNDAPFACLVLQSPIYSVYSVCSAALHAIAPGDFFCNGDALERVTTRPVGVLHGTDDHTVPYSHGAALYEVTRRAHDTDVNSGGGNGDNDDGAPCQMWTVHGADHNNIGERRYWCALRPLIAAFIHRSAGTAAAPAAAAAAPIAKQAAASTNSGADAQNDNSSSSRQPQPPVLSVLSLSSLPSLSLSLQQQQQQQQQQPTAAAIAGRQSAIATQTDAAREGGRSATIADGAARRRRAAPTTAAAAAQSADAF